MPLMLASAFGIRGQHITRKAEVEAALDTMLAKGRTASSIDERKCLAVGALAPKYSEMLEELSPNATSGQCIGTLNPETLRTCLRVVRHRGFQVCSMNMEAATDRIYKY